MRRLRRQARWAPARRDRGVDHAAADVMLRHFLLVLHLILLFFFSRRHHLVLLTTRILNGDDGSTSISPSQSHESQRGQPRTTAVYSFARGRHRHHRQYQTRGSRRAGLATLGEDEHAACAIVELVARLRRLRLRLLLFLFHEPPTSRPRPRIVGVGANDAQSVCQRACHRRRGARPRARRRSAA